MREYEIDYFTTEIRSWLPEHDNLIARVFTLIGVAITIFFLACILILVCVQWKNLCSGKTQAERLGKKEKRKKYFDTIKQKSSDGREAMEGLLISNNSLYDSYIKVLGYEN
jgi:hypothetical protein